MIGNGLALVESAPQIVAVARPEKMMRQFMQTASRQWNPVGALWIEHDRFVPRVVSSKAALWLMLEVDKLEIIFPWPAKGLQEVFHVFMSHLFSPSLFSLHVHSPGVEISLIWPVFLNSARLEIPAITEAEISIFAENDVVEKPDAEKVCTFL